MHAGYPWQTLPLWNSQLTALEREELSEIHRLQIKSVFFFFWMGYKKHVCMGMGIDHSRLFLSFGVVAGERGGKRGV